ncbi:hypothetical protein DRJ00_01725 [Candidatus Aerophobetes bacterium]|uniref:Uncharacterized protein n=1 Tax=Aerophobetes bacterium TaxID=2030807 RepID=A0A497E5U4_UNCAE|nr:MAG: hypothetical protein DRJ00_01725 [Candidatus Aerophobetes bacterium]
MSSGEAVSFRKEWSKTFQPPQGRGEQAQLARAKRGSALPIGPLRGERFPPSSILKEWSKTF